MIRDEHGLIIKHYRNIFWLFDLEADSIFLRRFDDHYLEGEK